MVSLHTIIFNISKFIISKIVISHTSSLILRRGGSGGLRIIDPPSEKGYRTRNLAVCDWRSCNFFPVLFKDFWFKKTSPPRNFASIYKKKSKIGWKRKKLGLPKVGPRKFWRFFEENEIFENFENFFRNHDFSIFKGFSKFSKNHDFEKFQKKISKFRKIWKFFEDQLWEDLTFFVFNRFWIFFYR